MAIKGAKVSDYNGKSLNAGDGHSQLTIEPDNKRVQELKEWYQKNPTALKHHNSVSSTGNADST